MATPLFEPIKFNLGLTRNRPANPFKRIGKEIAEESQQDYNIFTKALEIIGRPASSVAGFAKGLAGETGSFERAAKFAKQGISGERFFSFDDVLKRLGVPKLGSVDLPIFGDTTLRGTLGFALDVGLDPLTYVTLGGITNKAARAAGKGKPARHLTAAESQALGTIKGARESRIGNARAAFHKRSDREIEHAFDRRFQAARGDLEDLGIDLDSLDPSQLDPHVAISTSVDAKGVRSTNIVKNQANLERSKELARQDIDKVFDRDFVPVIDKAFEGSASNLLKDEFRELDEILDATDVLDLVKKADDQVMLLEMVENTHEHLLGVSRRAAAEKGFKGAINFLGVPITRAGRLLGIPDSQLAKMDAMVLKHLDTAFGALKEAPIFGQLYRAFNIRSGLAPLDNFLSHFVGKRHAATRQAVLDVVQVTLKQQDLLGNKTKEQKEWILKKAVDIMEMDNPRNILHEKSVMGPLPMTQNHAIAEEVALTMRQKLDEVFKREGISAKEIGLDLGTYLHGYFPRELSDEAKRIFDEAISTSSPTRQGLFLKSSQQRKGKFANMTTQEINEGLRGGWLDLKFLEDRLRKDKGLMRRLRRSDPEIAEFFVDDPAIAVASRLAASSRVVSNRQYVGAALKTFGRQVTRRSAARKPGEVLLAPTDMFQAFLRKEFNDEALNKQMKEIFGLPGNVRSEVIAGFKKVYENARLNDMVNGTMGSFQGEVGSSAYKLFTELTVDNPNLLLVMEKMGVPFYVMDKRVARHIDEVWAVRKDPAAQNAMLKTYDWVTSMFKRFTLSIFPEFHARNVISDIAWLNHLAGLGVSEVATKNGAYRHAFAAVFGHMKTLKGLKGLPDMDAAVAGLGRKVKFKDGTEQPLEELWREFVEGGGTGGLFRDVEIRASSNLTSLQASISERVRKGQLKRKLLPTAPDFPILEAGTRVGDGIQMFTRFAHFLAKRKQGLLPDEAMMSMKKYLFDYSELTVFERQFMRRVFPFYTWLRKNVPLQVEQAIKRPGAFANLQKAIHAVEDENVKKQLPAGGVPDFVKKEFGLVTRQVGPNNVEFLLLGSFIPAADLLKIGSFSDILRTGFKSINPQGQLPMEVFFGKNIFSGLDIEQFPGEKGVFLNQPMNRSTINTLRKFRILNTADRFFGKEDPNNPFRKKQFSTAEKFLSLSTGLRPVQVDPERVAKRRIFESKKIAGRLNQALKRARRKGDTVMFEYLQDLLSEVGSR